MNGLKVVAALCLGMFFVGCGAAGAGTCSVTLSGAQTGTFPCSVVLASDGVKTGFSIATTGGAVVFSGGVDLPATVLPQDYSSAEFSQFLTTTGLATWNQSLHHMDLASHPDKGSFLLHFSSVGDAMHQHARGTLTAEMPADQPTGATGTVTATVSFTDSIGASGGSGGGAGGGSGGGAGGGSGGGSGGGGGSTGSPCSVTVSGGLPTTTLDCAVNGLVSQGVNVFQVTSADSFVTASVQYSGPLTGTFTNAALGTATSEGVTVFKNPNQWIGGFSGSNAPIGTFNVNITNGGTMDPVTMLRSGMHGTWSATIPPSPPNTAAEVSVVITF